MKYNNLKFYIIYLCIPETFFKMFNNLNFTASEMSHTLLKNNFENYLGE